MAFDLSSIGRPERKPPRIVLYAPHGVGKTSFGAAAPKPIFLPLEDGMGMLDVPTFPIAKTWGEVTEALATLASEKHDFSTVVVDSLDWLEPLIWAETCRRHGWRDIETPGFGKGFVAAADVWREFLSAIDYLRERGMQSILIAHSEIKRFDDPSSDPYDRYQIKLQARAAALVQEWGDCVLFANYRVYTEKADVGFNKKIARGAGSGERVLFTEERPSHYAKNRFRLPPELPLDYETFQSAIFA